MKVLVGISGGVDSAYSVKLLREMGHEVECAVLVMHEYTESNEAASVAKSIGVKLHIVDCAKPFSEIVKENFINEYLRARTPNPCVLCNEKIKFKYLYDYAMENGFDAIATGHYARLCLRTESGYEPYSSVRDIPEGAEVLVGVARDLSKDQSYMLWRVPEYILKKLILPLSEVIKHEMKKDAGKLIPSLASKKESQEICFIKDKSYADYIEEQRGKCKKGLFVDTDGNKIGEHSGIIRYTVGQRKGLGISSSGRLFVTDINADTNEITLSNEDRLYSKVMLSDVIFRGAESAEGDFPLHIKVKLRYAQKPTPARLEIHGNCATLLLETPIRAATPGQSAVFYDGDILIGGGIIEKAE